MSILRNALRGALAKPAPRVFIRLFALLFALWLPYRGGADAVLLKDGNAFEGEIKETGGELEIVTDHGSFWVKKDEIKKRFGPADQVVAQAVKDQERGRVLLDEAKKIQEMEPHNAKLREAVKCLETARDNLAVAQEAYASQANYRKLSDLFKVVIQELRLYRDQFQVGGGAQAAKPPPEKAAEPAPAAAGGTPPPPPAAPAPPPPPSESDPAIAALIQEARNLLAKGSLDAAHGKYTQVVREGVEPPALRSEIAKAFYDRGSKMKPPHLGDIRRAFDLDPDTVSYYEAFLAACFDAGVASYKQKRWNNATKEFTLAIRVASDLIGKREDAKFYNKRAASYQLRGITEVSKFGGYGGHAQIRSDYTRAAADYDAVLRLDPNGADASGARGDLQNVRDVLNQMNNPQPAPRKRR